MNINFNKDKLTNNFLVINNQESATQVAALLLDILKEIQTQSLGGQTSCRLLKELKHIVYCIYSANENEYTASLHEVVNYVLLQMFQYEK